MPPLMKRQPKSGISRNSPKAEDKLLAYLNHGVQLSPDYKKHRNYFDACSRWWAMGSGLDEP